MESIQGFERQDKNLSAIRCTALESARKAVIYSQESKGESQTPSAVSRGLWKCVADAHGQKKMGIRTTQERWMTNIERNKADDKAQTFGEHVTHPSTAKSEKTSVSAPPPRSNPPYHDLEKMIAFERKMDQFRNLRAQIRMHEVQSVHRKTSAGASYLGQTCSRL